MWLTRAPLRHIRAALRRWRKRRSAYERLVTARVYAGCLLHNYSEFARICAPRRIAPVLKSNGYGHGLVEVARVLDGLRPPFLVVDGYFEALVLRNEGIRSPILVMGYAATENILGCRLPGVAFCVSDAGQLGELVRRLRRSVDFHLKVDTGMHRHGVPAAGIEHALEVAARSEAFRLVGVCSHFADAAHEQFTGSQAKRWNRVAALARQAVPSLPYLHVAATAGTMRNDEVQANVVRLGTGLYGIDSYPGRELRLRPALDVVTRIAAVKRVEAGAHIGYGLTYTADRTMLIALVPTGYHSCVDARLANRGALGVRGVECPIVGKVSMNTTTIDVSAVEDPRRGEEVVVISAEKDAVNSVAAIASLCEASPYHILAAVSPMLQRIVV